MHKFGICSTPIHQILIFLINYQNMYLVHLDGYVHINGETSAVRLRCILGPPCCLPAENMHCTALLVLTCSFPFPSTLGHKFNSKINSTHPRQSNNRIICEKNAKNEKKIKSLQHPVFPGGHPSKY